MDTAKLINFSTIFVSSIMKFVSQRTLTLVKSAQESSANEHLTEQCIFIEPDIEKNVSLQDFVMGWDSEANFVIYADLFEYFSYIPDEEILKLINDLNNILSDQNNTAVNFDSYSSTQNIDNNKGT